MAFIFVFLEKDQERIPTKYYRNNVKMNIFFS